MTLLQKDKPFQQAIITPRMGVISGRHLLYHSTTSKPTGKIERGDNAPTYRQYHSRMATPTNQYVLRKVAEAGIPAVETNDVRRLIVDTTISLLADRWRRSTSYMSSVTQMMAVPAYRQIVSIGKPAVPTLLREIERQPDFLVLALREITGADPVLAEHRGHVQQMAEDWVKWGRDRYGK